MSDFSSWFSNYPVALRNANLEPLLFALLTYAGVFVLAHLSRKLADRFLKKQSHFHTFLVEFFTALQMCTCVYENGVIVANYGVLGFFIAVSLILFAAGLTNRGAFVNILAYIEKLLLGHINLMEFLVVLLGQLSGSFLAFASASSIWSWTSPYSPSHQSAVNSQCNLALKVFIEYLPLVEGLYCLALRFVIGQFAQTEYKRRFLLPVIVSAFLSSSLRLVGVAGMNPIVAFARLTVCRGLSREQFYISFWGAAILGWIIGATLQTKFDKWWNGKSARQDEKKEKSTKNSSFKKKTESKKQK